MAIVYRIGNGSALTYTEVDGNFRYLLSNMSGSIVAITGSTHITGSLSVLPEGTVNQLTSSWAISASVATSASHAVTASYAANSSVSNVVFTNLGDASTQTVEGNVRLTGDIIAEQYIISSSVVHYTESFSSGSTKFGDDSLDTHQFTGSVLITGSITSTPTVINSLTASYAITASHALNTGGSGGIFAETGSYQATTNNIQITGTLEQGGDAAVDAHTNTDPSKKNVLFGKANEAGSNWLGFVHGQGNKLSGNYTHAEGHLTTASGQYSHTEGHLTQAIGQYSHAEGKNTTASANYSHAEGDSTSVEATCSYGHAEGVQTIVRWDAAHAEGLKTLASGYASHAEGYATSASANYAHAEGSGSHADGIADHAEGRETYANGPYAHAEGYQTTASGQYSHAEGQKTKALGWGTHTEGHRTRAANNFSHAEGVYTSASAHASHAEGSGSKATGIGSHAEGYHTTSSYNYSHAAGNTTYTQFPYQSVIGMWNESGSNDSYYTSSFQVGAGYSDGSTTRRLSGFEVGHILKENSGNDLVRPFIVLPSKIISPASQVGGSDMPSPGNATSFLGIDMPTGSLYMEPGASTLWVYNGRANTTTGGGTVVTPEGWVSNGGGYVETGVVVPSIGTKVIEHNLGTEHVIVQFVEGGATSGNVQCSGRSSNTVSLQSVGGATVTVLIKAV